MSTATEQSGRLDPGWLAETDEWVHTQLAANGATRTGPVETFRVRPWSIVRRAESSIGPVWFQGGRPRQRVRGGTGPGAHRLAARTRPAGAGGQRPVRLAALSRRRIHLREVLADRPEPARWVALLQSYAELQRDVASRADDLLALGVPDTRPARLPDELARLLDDPTVEAPDCGSSTGATRAWRTRSAACWSPSTSPGTSSGWVPAHRNW
jgi:hypothetical protein